MAYVTSEKGTSYKHLLGGPEVETLTQNVTLAGGQNVKEGTLLSVASGKYSATDKAGEAVAIAAENYNASDDMVITVYVRGRFNRNALIVADGDTIEAHEDQLRKNGIYLTTEKEG